MEKVGSLGRGRSVRSTNRKAESRKADCIHWAGVEFEVCVSGQESGGCYCHIVGSLELFMVSIGNLMH